MLDFWGFVPVSSILEHWWCFLVFWCVCVRVDELLDLFWNLKGCSRERTCDQAAVAWCWGWHFHWDLNTSPRCCPCSTPDQTPVFPGLRSYMRSWRTRWASTDVEVQLGDFFFSFRIRIKKIWIDLVRACKPVSVWMNRVTLMSRSAKDRNVAMETMHNIWSERTRWSMIEISQELVFKLSINWFSVQMNSKVMRSDHFSFSVWSLGSTHGVSFYLSLFTSR